MVMSCTVHEYIIKVCRVARAGLEALNGALKQLSDPALLETASQVCVCSLTITEAVHRCTPRPLCTHEHALLTTKCSF